MAVDYVKLRNLLDLSDLTDPQLDIHIETAQAIIDQHLTALYVNMETTLDIIHLWLSAHFASVAEGRASSEQVKVQISYQYKLGLRLEVTMYGQQAIALDGTGTLGRINKKGTSGKHSIAYLGGTAE